MESGPTTSAQQEPPASRDAFSARPFTALDAGLRGDPTPASAMQRSYLQDYEKGRGTQPRSASQPTTTSAPKARASNASSLAGDALRIEDACRAVERMQKRMEEVERHNLSLNENVKNCAHLIQLTQSFAEEQGHEQAKEVKRLTEQLSVVVAAAAEQEKSLAAATSAAAPSAAADPELASRMDQLQDQMKELVALKMSDVNERESEMSGFQVRFQPHLLLFLSFLSLSRLSGAKIDNFRWQKMADQSEILRQNGKFEAAMTEMTKRHAEVLYAKLDEVR